MYILGVAILNKTETPYKGAVSNVAFGEVFVGIGAMESHSHRWVERIIAKAHPEMQSIEKEATTSYGFICINDEGNLSFITRAEAFRAENIKRDTQSIPGFVYDYNVKWENTGSFMYKIVTDEMLKLLKDKYGLTEQQVRG